VFTIRTALLEVISLCGNSEDKTLSLIATALQNSSPRHQAVARLTSSESSRRINRSQPSHSGVLSAVHSTRNTSAATLRASSQPLAQIMNKLGSTEETVLMKFGEQVLDSVGQMVVNSHEQLCTCLWSSKGSDLNISINSKSGASTPVQKANTKTVTFDIPDSPAKVNSATELESELINSISQTILLPDTKVTPPLQLEVEIHFLIPSICLQPSLDEVQAQLSFVSGAIARVLRLIECWAGPSAGRTLYEAFESNGTLQSFHENIVQAMEGELVVIMIVL